MSKTFTEISAGMADAMDHAKGKSTNVIEHKPEAIDVKAIDVKAIGEKTGMSQ